MFDVGEQVPGAEGIQLRMRSITFEPEAAFPDHSHAMVPGFGYVLEGEFSEIRPEKARTLAIGESWFEDAGTDHRLTNIGEEPTTVLVIDLLRGEG